MRDLEYELDSIAQSLWQQFHACTTCDHARRYQGCIICQHPDNANHAPGSAECPIVRHAVNHRVSVAVTPVSTDSTQPKYQRIETVLIALREKLATNRRTISELQREMAMVNEIITTLGGD